MVHYIIYMPIVFVKGKGPRDKEHVCKDSANPIFDLKIRKFHIFNVDLLFNKAAR